MIANLVFVSVRALEVITLVPCMGMLAWFVHGFSSNNTITPAFVLVLFIASVFALAWAVLTLLVYRRHPTGARVIALVDLLLVGVLVAGAWYLRGVRNNDCTTVTRDPNWVAAVGDWFSISGPEFDLRTDKTCAMLKASWVFGIVNCMLFFVSAIAAFGYGDAAYRKDAADGTSSRRRRAYV